MSIQGDLRHRESKRKIFLDDSYKPKLQERSSDGAALTKRPQLQTHPSHNNDQSKRQIQQLQQAVKQLKTLLKQQREKYDQLFEEYEELIEKNNLIEKEYINLKYEHNKEIKNLKKTLKEQVEAEIKKCVEDFTNRINGECLWEGLKVKIEKFVSNIERISEIFLQRSRKYQNHEHHTKPTNALSKLNNIKQDEIIEYSKVQKMNIYEIEEKVETSPTKEPLKEVQAMVNSSLTNKQIVFQDEYYGELDDYQHLQEKIIQRKNYELMKNINRNSSQVRRKKIFNKTPQFQ